MVSQRCAEHDRHQRRGRRNGRQPEHADDGAEDQRRRRARRQQDEHHDRQRAAEIDRRQQVALGHQVGDIARADRAEDVEQPDHRDGPAADRGRQAAIDQIGRQMHGDEEELKAAGEVAEDQQHVAAMAERLRQRLRRRSGLAARRRRAGRLARRREHERQRQDRQQDRRRTPAACSASRCRRSARPPAARTGTGRTSRPRCRRRSAMVRHLRRQQLGEGADDQRERAAGKAEADQHAGRHVELERASARKPSRRCRRRRAARRRPAPSGAPKRSASAPANGCPAPHSSISMASASANRSRPQPLRGVHRRQEKSERRARAEADQADQAAADQDDERRAPGWRDGRTSPAIMPPPRSAAPPASRRSAG